MQVVKKVLIKIATFLLNLLVMSISLIIPKTDQIVIVGGWFGKRFADNSKYFFLYANQQKEELKLKRIIWITRSDSIIEELKENGFEAYKAWSVYSIWFHLRAKVHLIDQSIYDINPFFSVRSKRIYLWHGFPLKKVGLFMGGESTNGIKFGLLVIKKLLKYCIPGFWGKRKLLATSEFSSDVLGKAFEIPVEDIIISAYPRNYEPFTSLPIKYYSKKEKEHKLLIQQVKNNGYKIIGYIPTFRDKKATKLFGTSSQDELRDFFSYLATKNIAVVGKFHFVAESNSNLFKSDNFIVLPQDVDIYSFISDIDILITDYSSIYFDYLLWRKPIIFFPYDFEYYRDYDRGLIFEYDEFTPGPKVYNLSSLKELFEEDIVDFVESYNRKYENQSFILSKKIFDDPMKMDIKHFMKQIEKI